MIWFLQFTVFTISSLQSCISRGDLSVPGMWGDTPADGSLALQGNFRPPARDLSSIAIKALTSCLFCPYFLPGSFIFVHLKSTVVFPHWENKSIFIFKGKTGRSIRFVLSWTVIFLTHMRWLMIQMWKTWWSRYYHVLTKNKGTKTTLPGQITAGWLPWRRHFRGKAAKPFLSFSWCSKFNVSVDMMCFLIITAVKVVIKVHIPFFFPFVSQSS